MVAPAVPATLGLEMVNDIPLRVFNEPIEARINHVLSYITRVSPLVLPPLQEMGTPASPFTLETLFLFQNRDDGKPTHRVNVMFVAKVFHVSFFLKWSSGRAVSHRVLPSPIRLS